MEQLGAAKYPHYSNYTCLNHAYQDFATMFLSVINFVAPIRALTIPITTFLLFCF